MLSKIKLHKLQDTGNKEMTIKEDFPYPVNQYWVIKFEEGTFIILACTYLGSHPSVIYLKVSNHAFSNH